jgi:hypothetical protein
LAGIDARRWVSAVLFLAVLLGLTSVAVSPVFAGPDGSSTIAVVEVPYSVCVIQLGVQESNGTITWLPGYAYPGTPISECQNTTDVFGEDVLGGTIMFHQFILNGTSFKIARATLI